MMVTRRTRSATRSTAFGTTWLPRSLHGPKRVFVCFVLFSVLTASIWVGFLGSTVRDVAHEAARVHATSDARLFARILEQRIQAREIGTQAQAADEGLITAVERVVVGPTSTTREQLRRRLVEITERLANVDSMAVVDVQGALLGSSKPLTAPVGTDFSDRDWFTEVGTHGPYTSGVFRSVDGGVRITTTSTRIVDAAGRIRGVLVVSDRSTLQDAIDQLSTDPSVRVFVVTDDDEVVAGTGMPSTKLTRIFDFPGTDESFAVADGSPTRGEGYLVVRRHIAGAPWTVVVRVRETAGRGGSGHVLRVLVATFVAGVLVWMALAYAVSNPDSPRGRLRAA